MNPSFVICVVESYVESWLVEVNGCSEVHSGPRCVFEIEIEVKVEVEVQCSLLTYFACWIYTPQIILLFTFLYTNEV